MKNVAMCLGGFGTLDLKAVECYIGVKNHPHGNLGNNSTNRGHHGHPAQRLSEGSKDFHSAGLEASPVIFWQKEK